MSDIPSFPYVDLWNERVITSVANLTRRDGEEFLKLARRVPVKTKVETFPLEEKNTALEKFRAGKLSGAAVLAVSSSKCLTFSFYFPPHASARAIRANRVR